MIEKLTKLFLRLAISVGFLSAVTDRFGLWNKEISAWGNWNSFLEYTEIVFALCLLVGFKTELFAKLSGILLLIFALSMTFSTGIKGVFDFSVFTASAGAFALSLLKGKYMELDNLISKPDN